MPPRRPPLGRPRRTGATAGHRVTLRLDEAELGRYTTCAAREGLSLSEWLRAAAELALARGATR